MSTETFGFSNFILVGPKGSGKSSTGNSILADLPGHPFFSIGDSYEDGTVRIKLVDAPDGSLIGDCQGFGEESAQVEKFGNLALYNNFCESSVHNRIKDKSFKFFFCIKFDGAHIPSTQFTEACEQFCKVFGEEGVAAMVLIVIQTSNALCLDEFKPVLHKTPGFKLLKAKNKNRDIPFVMWDNKQHAYPNQLKNLRREAANVNEMVFQGLRFEVIERQIEALNNQRKAREAEAKNAAVEKEKTRLEEELRRKEAEKPKSFWERLFG